MSRVGIIGGGIAGLAAAHRIQKKGVPVQVLEATARVGGVIRSTRTNGFLVEEGPNSLRPTDALQLLIDDLDLTDEQVWANEAAATRYVVRDGRPRPLPTSFGAFLTTDLFSTRAKVRLLAEPFMRSRPPGAAEESLAAFTRRRLGPEVLDYAVAPFVGGVFAGDPERLSARHAFERLVHFEQEHGSLFWGAVRSGGQNGSEDDPPSSLFSFRNGLETLPRSLARTLGDRITRQAPVTALRREADRWTVETDPPSSEPRSHRFDAVICTVPLHGLPQFDFESPVDRSPLRDVSYPPVSIVALGYESSAVDHPLDGFGMLVPPVEASFDILGTIFSSSLFPGRAPRDHVLLTTFVGGARNPTLAEQAPSTRREVVERDLTRLLGVEGDPLFVQHVQWPRAIPQYTLGYGRVKDTLQALESQHDRLYFAGNYRQGVSVGDTVASGTSAADRALHALS